MIKKRQLNKMFLSINKLHSKSTNLDKVINHNKNRFPKPKAIFTSEIFEATFIGHQDGINGFICPIDTKRYNKTKILIDWQKIHKAVHGDLVQARFTGITYDGQPKAQIIKILSHNSNPIPAYIQKKTWGWIAVPLEPKFSQSINIPATDLAHDGDIVNVKLDTNVLSNRLQGTVINRIGRINDLNIENKLTAAMFNLRTDFPNEVIEELSIFSEEISKDWLHDREDLRDRLIVTVDPLGAKDLDDAISIESLPKSKGGGWLLGVHVADVSHYVHNNTALDNEAILRGNSVYFPDQCIPMLPELLSGKLCSLIEGENRLTVTVWIMLTKNFNVIKTRFTKSIINSRKQLTYNQVKEACLDRLEPLRENLGTDICQMLEHALHVSRNLTKIRIKRGALNIASEEAEFIFDDNGRPIDIRRHTHNDAHRMIEEFMLLANEAVANFLTNKNIPTIYRTHDVPDPLKLELLKEVISSIGLIKTRKSLNIETLNLLISKNHNNPLGTILNDLLIRSLKRAEYNTKNIGHYGLALDNYLHFTSPIRRYPDLITHRLLSQTIKKITLPNNLSSYLEALANNCSKLERNAAEAERKNRQWKTCLIMKEKIKQHFNGTISGFYGKNMAVRLNNHSIEVTVYLGNISKDFIINPNYTKATSNNMNLTFHVGCEIEVEIAQVDEVLHKVYASVLRASISKNKGKFQNSYHNYSNSNSKLEIDFKDKNSFYTKRKKTYKKLKF